MATGAWRSWRRPDVTMGEPGSPIPPPAGGSGRAQPVRRGMGRDNVSAVTRICGAALTQGDGETRWEGRGGLRPHAGGWGNPVAPWPHPVGGSGRATPSRRGVGKPGFPMAPPGGGLGRAAPSRRGMGKPGCPVAPPGGRVGEGYALTQGDGETRLPHGPTRWEGLEGRSEGREQHRHTATGGL